MHDPLRDLSDLAEDAVSDIRLIVRDYAASRAVATRATAGGRFGRSGTGFGDRTTQFAVANIVGVVEQYVEQTLLNAGSNPKKVRRWDDKKREWRKAFGADIEEADQCPSFTPMRGYYEARNAIMHRRGELTHQQRAQDVYKRLVAAGVERVGYAIVLTENTVHACADVCVRCVEELDKTARPKDGSSM